MTPAPPLRELYEVFSEEQHELMPLGVRVDGTILAQGLTGGDGSLQEQAQSCFERLRDLAQRGGATLENVGRVTCYVLDAEDRDPVYALWHALFPDPSDRPAFKVLTGPLPPGQRIRLDAIVVPAARRTRLDIPSVEARDPTVLIGDWLFTSRLHGIAPETGRQLEGLEAQFTQAFANAKGLIRRANRPELQLAQLTAYGAGLPYRQSAAPLLKDATAGDVAQNVIESWVRPGTEVMLGAVALSKGTSRGFRELYLAPERYNQAVGFKYGRLVLGGAIGPDEGGAGVACEGGIEEQLQGVLTNMDRLLHVAGCGRENVARVSFYMRDLEDRPALNEAWQAWFPDSQDRPPHTYLPASLPEGQHVSLQVIALEGSERRVLSVPGVEHGDPMSLGAVNDNLLVTSRIFGGPDSRRDDDPSEHTRKCLETVSSLLSSAGGAWPGLQQLTVYASAAEYSEPVRQLLHDLAPDADGRLAFLETDLGRRTLLPRLQLLAVV